MSRSRKGPHMGADMLRTLLFELGNELAKDGSAAEIAIYGGSALLLTFEGRASTKDIDFVSRGGDAAGLVQAAEAVGARHGLENGWLNDAVSIFSSDCPDYRLVGDFPSEGPGLRVFAASSQYMLAMKLMSMRSPFETNDLQDVWDLIDRCEVETPEEAMSFVGKFYPGESMPDHKAMILRDVFEAKHRGEEYNPLLGWGS